MSPVRAPGAPQIVALALVLIAGPHQQALTQESQSVHQVASPERVTLGEVLKLLREHSPRISADRADIDIAEADVVKAGLLPNPSINYTRTGTVHGVDTIGGTQHLASVDIPLLIAGQRSVRRRAAELQVVATRSLVRARYVDAAVDARHLFITLLADQARVRLLEAALADLESVERIVAGRAQAGVKSQYDVERIRVEVATGRNRLAESQVTRDDTAGQLAKLVGMPGWLPVAEGEFRPRGAGPGMVELWQQAEKSLPAIVAAEKKDEVARAEIDVASRERWPTPVFSVGGLDTTDPHGVGVLFGISLPIPLFDRGQGGMARARAEAISASRNREAVLAESHVELEKAVHLLNLHRTALESFERDVMARLSTLRQMAEEAYRNGQGGIVEFLDALRVITEAGPNHADLVEKVLQAEVDVDAAAGIIDLDYNP